MENKVEIDINGALGSIQSLIGSLDTLNSSLTKVLNNTGVSTLSNEITQIKNEANGINPVFNKLKELQSELRKSGDSKLAIQIKEYTQELYKTQSSTADEKIKEVRQLIEKKLGSNFLKDFNDSLKNTDDNKKGNAIQSLRKMFNIGAVYTVLRKGFNIAKDLTKANIDMIETYNLFEVSMGKTVDEYGKLDVESSKYYIKALNFQNQMNEKLATNKAELMEYQSMYYSMLKSQGIDLDSSYLMSESLTKAGYDIASLYNLDVEDAMSKLKSGLAGQVEPLRKIGIDISESSLQKVLDDVGIERSVQQLSYAEKEVARYIAIVNQGKQAQGDFAKTMDSSANQIKIFHNQLAELKQVAGAFINNVFGGILVYVNAIIMVIKEILKSFADLLGWDLESSGVNSLDTSIEDIGTNLNDATKKAKEFKKQLMGFDEINNITLPTDNSDSGTNTIGGIDTRLLNNLTEWDNKMDSISGKAQEIRDKMLEWLGFKRNDDGTWKLGEGYTNFEKIKDVVLTIGSLILGWKLGGFISSISEALTKLGLLKGAISKLKAGIGIGLVITSIYFVSNGISGIRNGEITGENLLKSLGGSIGLGVGAGILTGNVMLGLTIGLVGIEFTMMEIGKQTTQYKLYETLKETLGNFGIKVDIGDSLEMYFSTFLCIFEGFKFLGLEEKIIENVKNTLYNVANYIEKIPIIGSSIANGIRSALKIEWNETGNTIKYTTEQAMKDAEPWVKTNAEKLGRNTAQAYRSGISNTESEVSQTTIDIITRANRSATPTATSEGYALGNTFGSSGNRGIASVSLNSGTQQMVNTARQTILNNTLFGEGSNLARTAKTGFSSNSNAYSEGMELGNTLQTGLEDKSLRYTGYSLAQDAKDGFSSNDMEYVGYQATNGIASGMENGKWSIASVATSLGNWALSKFKSIFGIHSPSKVMADEVGKYISLGLAEGIEDETDSVMESIQTLSKGIVVNTKDILVDTNQYIDYGAIKGQVQTQSNITFNDNISNQIATASYEAFCKAMREEGVKVNVEAKTEEGVIFKKVQTEANEYAIQTGENPFPVLA